MFFEDGFLSSTRRELVFTECPIFCPSGNGAVRVAAPFQKPRGAGGHRRRFYQEFSTFGPEDKAESAARVSQLLLYRSYAEPVSSPEITC
jgi:hypothetical protein